MVYNYYQMEQVMDETKLEQLMKLKAAEEAKRARVRKQIPCGPQLEMFEKGQDREKPVNGIVVLEGRCFKNRDPRGIRFGDMWLDEYLKEMGIKEPFVVRTLLEKQDWSGFEVRYGLYGCAAYGPMSMTGMILYGLMQGVETLRGLERLARTDVGCMWVSGGITPDHATIGRFIVLQGDLLTDDFFEKLTKDILKITGSTTSSLAGDGTVLQSFSSRYKTIRHEAAQEMAKQAQEKAQGSESPKQQAKAELAQKVLDTIEARIEKKEAKGKDTKQVKISPHEPEAVVQPLKEGVCAPSYKPSTLVNNDKIIVGLAVDPSNESTVVASMLDMAERIGEEKVSELMLDAGYFNKLILELCIDRDINLLCPEGRSLGEGEWIKDTERYPKSAFTYHEDTDTYVCPQGQVLTIIDKYAGSESSPAFIRYGTPACAHCPVREQCTKDKNGRRIKRYAGDEAKEAQRQVMKDPRARKRYRQRQAIVEPVFGYMKRVLKFTRFRRRGLAKVRVEFALYAMAYNLCRLKALLSAGVLALFWLLIRTFRRIYAPQMTFWEKFAPLHFIPAPKCYSTCDLAKITSATASFVGEGQGEGEYHVFRYELE